MHFLGHGERRSESHLLFHYGFFSRICSSLGLMLLFTSYVAPYWIVQFGPTPMNIGLWNTCNDKSCREVVKGSGSLLIIRILMTIVVLLGVVAVSLSFITNSDTSKVKWPLVSNLSTGLLSLATMLIFGLKVLPEHIYIDQDSRHPNLYNWAYWVGCIGTSFFITSEWSLVVTRQQESADGTRNGQQRAMGWSEVATSWMTSISLLMLITAVMDHHWIYVEATNQNYYSGIWKVCTRVRCSSIIAISTNVRSAKALLVLALFSAFVGSSFMTFTYRYFSRYAVYRYLVSAMASFLTASLVFLAMSVYTTRVAMHGNTKTARITYQWAFYLAWCSCPCFILSGLLGLMAHSHSPVQRLSFSDNESISLSSASKSSSSNADDEGKHSVLMSDDRRFGALHI